MEVHAHTHTARKKCPPDRTGRDSLFLGVPHVIPCSVLRGYGQALAQSAEQLIELIKRDCDLE
jgi:hypothetical protein